MSNGVREFYVDIAPRTAYYVNFLWKAFMESFYVKTNYIGTFVLLQ